MMKTTTTTWTATRLPPHGAGRIDWADIHAEPQRLEQHGVALTDAMRRIHAVDANGQLRVGVPAFLAVWEQLPGFWAVLPPVLRTVPFALPLASAAYSVFARLRLQLTGRGRALEEGTACAPK